MLTRTAFSRLRRDPEGENYRYLDQRLEPAMLLLSIAFIPILLAPVLADLSSEASRGLILAGWVLWGLFAAEFLLLLYLAPDRRQMLRDHKVDALIVFVPILRPLRILRVLTVGSALGRMVVGLRRVGRQPGFAAYFRFVLVVIVAGAGFTLAFEHGQTNSTIASFGDALWWSFVTCTTVGYGDFSPVTTGGRITAGMLMVVGIAGLSVITASIAALFVERGEETELERLRDQLDRIESLLAQPQGSPQE